MMRSSRYWSVVLTIVNANLVIGRKVPIIAYSLTFVVLANKGVLRNATYQFHI